MLDKKQMKFIFRNIVIFEYDKDTKQVRIPNTEGVGNNFNFCKFIPEDYKLIGDYFNTIYKDLQGKIVKLKDIEVY